MPACGGPVEVRVPDQTQRVACAYCGSMLDATRDLAVLEALARPDFEPGIPLGSKGRLAGIEWTAIGAMERSVTVEGVRYPWREYLLYEPRHGFRWLVEARGHWSFVEPIAAGDVGDRYGQPLYGEEKFAHFQSGTAAVDHVLGEFYWAVARGDRRRLHRPTWMLSRSAGRRHWSLGTYTSRTRSGSIPVDRARPPRAKAPDPTPWRAPSKQVFKRALLPWPRSSSCPSAFPLPEHDDPPGGDRDPDERARRPRRPYRGASSSPPHQPQVKVEAPVITPGSISGRAHNE